jgi:putative ABC transport system permease protein
MIVLLSTSFWEHFGHNNKPLTKLDRMLFVSFLDMKIDKDGVEQNANISPPSKYFVNRYLKTLQTPENVACISYFFKFYEYYTEHNKTELSLKYCDDELFNICDFKFLEGRAFNKTEHDSKEPLIVVDKWLASIINPNGSAIGKSFDIYSKTYKVVGVVENVDISAFPIAGNVYAPISTEEGFDSKANFGDPCCALILAKSKKDFKHIKDEVVKVSKNIELLDDYQKRRNAVYYVNADRRGVDILRSFFQKSEAWVEGFINWGIFIVALLFLLLPTVNLVNINKTRMDERATEIGVRKSFGAKSTHIAFQFLVENVFITILGCALSVLFTGVIILYLNNSGLLGGINLSMYPASIINSFLVCILLGLLSGVLPAWRMSKLEIAKNIKS